MRFDFGSEYVNTKDDYITTSRYVLGFTISAVLWLRDSESFNCPESENVSVHLDAKISASAIKINRTEADKLLKEGLARSSKFGF